MTFLLLLALTGGTADRVVAVVDDDPILESDLDAMVYISYLQNPALYYQSSEDSLREEFLDLLISQKLIFKKGAADTTLDINYGEITNMVDAELDLYYKQFDTIPDVLDSLEAWGLTRNRLRRILADEQKFQAIVQHLLVSEGKTQPYVSPNEIREYYEARKDSMFLLPGYIRISHIALMIGPSQREIKRIESKFNDVTVLLSRGAEFDLIVEQFSEDPETRYKGGSLGWIKPGELPPEIDSVLFKAPVGELIPLQSRDGYHLFLVERKLEDKLKTRHILFKTNITSRDTARVLRQAAEIRSEILSGDITFAEAAEVYTQDFATAEQGGFVGEFSFEQLRQLAPPFDSVAIATEPGDVSEPFLSESGVHLLKVDDKWVLPFEEIQADLRAILVAQKRQEWLEEIVEEAKADYYVERKEL
ncbi:hypothetical protein GF359_05260 [candidate division WOR-3 bacterium]|uniref:PpiC domain-containing protein n=1 Tax=candidate division WOR-3 bacterium TaxID=2052148 RepID=A0A9D5QCJ0_UNCW3|nr:hypothetical protein [candidate division WOR-3 bacterium]MBD3364604.1 hypothetical protein [candidate division WOR-3 bacterium]